MIWLLLFVTLSLMGIAVIAVINAVTFPRLSKVQPSVQSPLVSLLVPARNEAQVIGQTVRTLLTQTYPNFEVILLDDNSSDDTVAVARRAGEHDNRLKIVTGARLPADWLGKNWACHQLAQTARGEWLVFADADVHWTPDALAALMTETERSRADLLAVWPTQQTKTWSERLVVPLMALAVIGYLPLPLVHYTPWASFAAATGQLLAFKRESYTVIGGHAAVRNKILEDVLLARRVKQHGLRLRLADAAGLVSCRMYRNWPEVRDGFAKNILAGYGDSVLGLAVSTLFHWLIFIAPWIWLALGWMTNTLPGWPLWPLLLIGLGVGARMLTAAVTRQKMTDALLMPVSVLLMTIIAARAVWWRWRYGGPFWKGRAINPHVLKSV